MDLKASAIVVPQEISVIVCDNIKLAEYCYPFLITIHIPRDCIGKMAFDSVIEDQGRLGRELVIRPEFVVWNSTGVARSH